MSPPATESPAKLKATEELNLLAAMINPVPVKKVWGNEQGKSEINMIQYRVESSMNR